jgi:hypothetical protein
MNAVFETSVITLSIISEEIEELYELVSLELYLQINKKTELKLSFRSLLKIRSLNWLSFSLIANFNSIKISIKLIMLYKIIK